MRICVIAMAALAISGTCQARQQMSAGRAAFRLAMLPISPGAAMPPLAAKLAPRIAAARDYRIASIEPADRSAHTRAIDEMNAINLRRPRIFRFRPVMALTFDAADIDGPARMSGIAPSLMGLKRAR